MQLDEEFADAVGSLRGDAGTMLDLVAALGCVDGFEQDEDRSERGDGSEASGGFLAAQCHTLRAFQLAHHLVDAGATTIQGFGETGGDCLAG